jgi:hypothetical protein
MRSELLGQEDRDPDRAIGLLRLEGPGVILEDPCRLELLIDAEGAAEEIQIVEPKRRQLTKTESGIGAGVESGPKIRSVIR